MRKETPKDYYAILGVGKEADRISIKKAFRARARVLHPDVNHLPDARTSFQDLQEAYHVLSDPDRRRRYDQGEFMHENTTADQYPQPWTAPERAWNPFTTYRTEYRYVPTDYTGYSRPATYITLLTLLFSITFFMDLMFFIDYPPERILAVQNKGLITQKADDLDYVVVKTTERDFEKQAADPELVPGEMIRLRKSRIYGFIQYQRAGATRYVQADALSTIVYVGAIGVCVASLYAIIRKKKPEQKFNAALIASFFSLLLTALLLFS